MTATLPAHLLKVLRLAQAAGVKLHRDGDNLLVPGASPTTVPTAMAALAAIAGVTEVHDLHVWAASTSEISLTAHLVVAVNADRDAVLAAATEVVSNRFHVVHSTIQIEGLPAGNHCLQRPGDAL